MIPLRNRPELRPVAFDWSSLSLRTPLSATNTPEVPLGRDPIMSAFTLLAETAFVLPRMETSGYRNATGCGAGQAKAHAQMS